LSDFIIDNGLIRYCFFFCAQKKDVNEGAGLAVQGSDVGRGVPGELVDGSKETKNEGEVGVPMTSEIGQSEPRQVRTPKREVGFWDHWHLNNFRRFMY
jgi:hypothetical protein